MAGRRSTPKELQEAVREAVDRTVQATVGSAERTRTRAQGAVDDLVGTVDELVRGAEAGLARSRRAVSDALPATQEDVRALRTDLRRIGRRLDAIEERLPGGAGRRTGAGTRGRKTSRGR